MRVVTVVGARPQLVKASAVTPRLRALPGVRETLVHTGQHYDPALSDVFFEELELPPPDHHLGVGSGSHGAQTGAMLAAVERVLVAEPPDVVLVYGDTNSTLAGALAAVKLGLPVAHVEAGLRSGSWRMAEEINRTVTDRVSRLLFAPTAAACANLAREGVDGEVHRVGDVMLDVTLRFRCRAGARPSPLARLGLSPGGYVLATVHRAENTDDPARLAAIAAALAAVAERLPVVLPLHPRTRRALAGSAAEAALGRVRRIEPVGFLDMAALEAGAALVATDSGGVQKEAYFHAVPCVTLRDETEWVELVEAGWNRLASPAAGAASLAAAIEAALAAGRPAAGDAVAEGLYGDGHAGERICRLLAERFA
jgi:UDP-GlcNAc3NAcA epimerase